MIMKEARESRHEWRGEQTHVYRNDSAGSAIRTLTPPPGALLIVRLPPAMASRALWGSGPPPAPAVELLGEVMPTTSSAPTTSSVGLPRPHVRLDGTPAD